ncbi:M48 family metalloprotease [Aliiroseovarius sp.]|uniref:M48 family metalloprotease n=1 Tax=Aliiroseovarius sp. TaxID=1872442 RepID=UPI003BAC5D13
MVRRVLTAALAALMAVVLTLPARAQTILRDPDIEHALKQLAKPVIEAAGLSAGRIKILVIKDDSLNAFVADHDHVFLHSGLILRLDEPEQLQAVIAHELAHIANGHLARRATNFQSARNVALIGTILAGAAAAAGGGKGAAGVAIGVQDSALRRFFVHTRAEEASADQSALRYMAAAGIDPHGMHDVLELFRGQEALSVGRRDPYLLTHPLNRDRMRAVAGFVAGHAHHGQERPEDDYWFARARGKLSAFLRAPRTTFRAVGRKPGQGDIVARMRRAVAFHRQPQPDKAIAEIQALVAAYPNDPYLAELQGQILLESRKFGAAVQAYRRAAQKAPSNGLILAGYGRALLAQNTAASNAEALKVLTRARARDPYSPLMLRDLGLAYSRAGNNGMAALMSAERYALIGRLKDAVPHAKRAEGLLPRGSSGWNRAQDILTAARAVSK